MNQTFKNALSLLPLLALAACGGGGSSDAGPPNSVPAMNSTQTELQQLAALGVATLSTTHGLTQQDLPYLSGAVANLGSDVGGTRVLSITSCSAGTATISVVKSASRTGLVAGDQATFTYDRCNIGGNGLLLNGKVVVTAQGAVTPASGGNFSVNYAAVMTGFSTTFNGVTRTYDGALSISSSVVNATTYSTRFAVPAGQRFTSLLTGPAAPMSFSYGPETTFVSVDNVISKSATRKLDGNFNIRGTNTPILPLLISTPTALTGTTSNTNIFTATAGTINTTSTTQNVATSTTVNGANATVSGDTDKNGSLDLTFTIPWTALVTP